MKTFTLQDSLRDLLKEMKKNKKPFRVRLDGEEFVILPALKEETLKQLEYFLEDYLDQHDDTLKEEIQEARNEIRQGKFLTHDEIWNE